MPKKQRTYWIQLIFDDGLEDEWLESFSGYNDTCVVAGGLLVKRGATRALILRHWAKRAGVAANKDILADFDLNPRPDTQTITIHL